MVSERPWSDYSSSDYTLEQWHAACLIHLHDGTPTSKSECKVPVKTPDGALNRNGVHAAAAALAGARGGVNASPQQIAKAKRAVVRLYNQLSEDPPESMIQSTSDTGLSFIEHHGVKGMKWGVRKRRNESARARTFGKAKGKEKSKDVKDLSDQELRNIVNRMNMEQQYKRLASGQNNNGSSAVKKILAAGATINSAIAFSRSPAGRALTTALAGNATRLVRTSKAVSTIGR
jgi:hypothetical protein